MNKTLIFSMIWMLATAVVGNARGKAFFYEVDVFVAGENGIFEYRIPALVTTNKGTLIAICDGRVEKRGDAPNNIDLVMKRSLDGGRTWSPMKVVVDFPGQEAACDPSLVVDRHSGTIWLFYDYIIPAPSGRKIMLHTVYSEDDGKTWSKPRKLTEEVMQSGWEAVCVGPGKGIYTSNDTLVVPCYIHASEGHQSSIVVFSKDHGKTWQASGEVGLHTGEAQVVELVDGRLMINIRMQRGMHRGNRVIAFSSDGGRRWSEPEKEEELIGPVCQASTLRYTEKSKSFKRNRILFSNPANQLRRSNMTVRISYDEGRNWPVSKVVYPGPSAYSCLTIVPEQGIGLLYEKGKDNAYERIAFACFNLEWLTDGADQLRRKTGTCKRTSADKSK